MGGLGGDKEHNRMIRLECWRTFVQRPKHYRMAFQWQPKIPSLHRLPSERLMNILQET